MDPLEILPQEVWTDVLSNLTCHKDLQSAYNTCSLWRSLLTQDKKLWMFPGVFPSLIKYLPKSDILNTRLICKSWNKSIQSYLAKDQPAVAAPGNHYLITQRTSLRNLEADFQIRGHGPMLAISRFQRDFGSVDVSRRKNPFVSRSLFLTLFEMNLETLEFFEKFGTHLWSLRLSILQLVPPEITTPVQIARFVWSVLLSTPNLRKLDLYTMQNLEDNPRIFSKREKKVQMQELRQFLETNPAPHLPQLTNLEVDTSFHLIRRILETAYAPQLKKYVHITSHKFVPSTLANLTEVAWHFIDGCKLGLLKKLKSLKSPCLERLYIYVRHYNGQMRTNSGINFLLNAVENFKSSIVHLYIFWEHFEGTLLEQVNLPLVKELSLEILRFREPENFNLHFLEKLPSIRKLKCVFWEEGYRQLLQENEESDLVWDKVDLHYYLDEDGLGGPYDSNIWELVPSLDAIEIQVVSIDLPPRITKNKIYTRAQKERNLSSGHQLFFCF